MAKNIIELIKKTLQNYNLTKSEILATIPEVLRAKFASEDIAYVCQAWNTYAPIRHQVFTRKIQSDVYDALQDFPAETIVDAIKKYSIVVNTPNKYWWTISGYLLPSFLTSNDGSTLLRFVDSKLADFEVTKGKSINNILPKL